MLLNQAINDSHRSRDFTLAGILCDTQSGGSAKLKLGHSFSFFSSTQLSIVTNSRPELNSIDLDSAIFKFVSQQIKLIST